MFHMQHLNCLARAMVIIVSPSVIYHNIISALAETVPRIFHRLPYLQHCPILILKIIVTYRTESDCETPFNFLKHPSPTALLDYRIEYRTCRVAPNKISNLF